MATEFNGKIELDIRDSEPDWGPYAAPTAPEGAPNVLYLVWDDTGIATWDCFGGLVEMPAMSRIAERGVRLSQFHTTALCSPTRASLLTGRNATTVGMATIEEFTDGFPNCNGRIPNDTALLSEVLAERGYNTYCVGKWHLTPLEESNLAATKRHWPLVAGIRAVLRLHGRRDRPVVSRAGLRQPSRRPARHARGRLSPVEGPGRQDHRVHPRREGDRTRQAVVQLRVPRCRARAAPRVQGVGRQVRGQVRHGLRALPRDRAGEPEEARHRAAGHRIVAGQPVSRRQGPQRRTVAVPGHRAAVGHAERRGEAAVQPDGRGVRRLPVLHRCPDRPRAGLSRGVRAAGQHHHRRHLRQRRQR